MRAAKVALMLAFAWLAMAADEAPPWLKDLSQVTVPLYGSKVTTVVLLDEERTTVGDTGRLTTVSRKAIRILARQGADVAFVEQYDSASDKVRDFRVWMIGPSGKVKKYANDAILDIACAENDIYNECRRRFFSGRRDAEAGAVFGYEATVEHQSFSNQLMFRFQEAAPVRQSRFIVTIPAGWELKASPFNGAPRETAAGATYTWQMENLPAIESEVAAPAFLTLAPWVGVNLLGPGGKRPSLSWAEAAKQLYELNADRAEPSPAITAKAKALTEGVGGELDKIRALAKFAQQVNYVSVQVDIAKGGGYRPHLASQVFEKLYGDCKDKANLLRSMLKAVGITAYPVAIFSGDRTHVNPEWPSLGAFNHAISAIRVSAGTNGPAVLDHPKLGRLLFFDPTDAHVAAGYLPDHEQASYALVASVDGGDLVRVPAAAAAAGTFARQVEATLSPDGAVEGSFVERITGESLADAVAGYRSNSKADYVKAIERWLGSSVPGANASGIEVEDGAAEFVLKGKFASRAYAQMPQPRMMIFRAALLRHSLLRLIEKTRQHPIIVDTDALEEAVRITLPQGYKVDELPDAVRLNSPYGKFEASWAVEGGTLTFRRKFEMQAQAVPAAQFNELKKFLDRVSGSAESPVVLVKQ